MSNILDFVPRKDEVEHNLDFKSDGVRTSNVPFTMRELQSAIRTAWDTAAGSNDFPYSNIRQLPDVAMATVLALYNAIRTQEDYSKRWKEPITILLLKGGKDTLKAENYCPVSLTCCLGNLLKRMVN